LKHLSQHKLKGQLNQYSRGEISHQTQQWSHRTEGKSIICYRLIKESLV